ncbi:MAG: phosphopantetheine-binding protein, partial [Planctomycetota bacterium]
LRSGDLGFLSDGELYVTGRLKDVIIIRGRNHYPHDIELTAWDTHGALLRDCGAAFAVEADGQEGLVVVQEIDRHHRSDDLPSVFRDIRLAVIAEHELDPRAIVLIRQASLPRTTSGKIQRSLCRAHFLEGTLNVVAQWSVADQCVDDSGQPLRLRFDPDTERIAIPRDGLTASDIDRLAERIEARLLDWLVARSDLPSGDVDRQRPFAEYGIDSLAAVELSADLERWLEVPTPAIAAWNYPTPELLARFLAEQAAAAHTLASESGGPPTDFGITEFETLLAEIEQLSDHDARDALRE